MILFLVFIFIIRSANSDICSDQTWYEICNNARDIILSPEFPSQPLTCCCLSNQTQSALFHYPSIVPNGNPKIERYHYDQQYFLQTVAKHGNFLRIGMAIACWGDTCNLSKDKRKVLVEKKIAILLHTFEKTENDTLSLLFPSNFIFIPDHLFIRSNGYKELINSTNALPKSIAEREPIIFWRGSSTGRIFSMVENDRYKMCLLAKNYSWVDAGITQAYSQYSQKIYADNGVYRSYKNEYEWIKYRGIIDIDGSVNAWGLNWRLASGSVVFKVESNWTNALIEKMIPWKHYISLKEDFSDFKAFTSLITNENFLPIFEKIARNAFTLVKEFSFENEVDRVVASLNDFWMA